MSVTLEPQMDINAIDEVEIKIECSDVDIEEEKAKDPPIFDNDKGMSLEEMIKEPTYNLWTSKATSCLISQYKKYRSMVGQTNEFRSLRDMFERISIEMQKYGFYFSPQKCENKWRVLERKYKNLVLREMLKKPGRIKHYGYWEHKRALDEIFNEKRKYYYLKETEIPPITTSTSTQYTRILPKPSTQQNRIQPEKNTQQMIRQVIAKSINLSNPISKETLVSSINTSTPKTEEELLKETGHSSIEKLIVEMKNIFETAEKNKERRHKEKMILRQSELKIQEKLLKIKEQKLELEKKKILAMAQSI